MARRKARTEYTTPLGELGAASKPPLKHIPFPGLIDENPWEVREGRWPTFIDRSDLDGEGGIMRVPLGDDDVSEKLRLQELAHVSWTPELTDAQVRALGVDRRTIEACEDGRIIKKMNDLDKEWERINKHAKLLPGALVGKHNEDFRQLAGKLARYDTTTGELTPEDPNAPPKPPGITLTEAARLIASSRGYYEEKVFNKIASDAGLGWVRTEVDKLHKRFIGKKKKPTFDDTIAYAQELERFFHDMEEQLGQLGEDLDAADLRQMMEMHEPSGMIPELGGNDPRWGEMSIEHAPLTEILQGSPARKVRATDLGAVPRYMHRLVSDNKVFGRRRKQRRFQGTVLIDHSGSMSLTPEEVDEILFRWPAVTIATYSGYNGSLGVLRIVAKNGRRANVEWLGPPAGADNAVDGPALDWLAKQRGPRVWISDGGVTGMGGHNSALVADAASKVRRGKIKRIPNVQELLGR